MKMIIKIVLLYTVILFFTGCENNEDAFVYMLSNQSYSQMMSYIIKWKHGF